MKKLSLLIIGLVLAQLLNAQSSFYRGAFLVSANFGIDANKTYQSYLNGPENKVMTLTRTVPASEFNITSEFGLCNWLGIGLIERLVDYYGENNEVNNIAISAGDVDFGVVVNLHLMRCEHLDVLIGYDGGISQFYYNINDASATQVNGNGIWSDIHAAARYYFSRFGMNLNLYIPIVKYNDLQSSGLPTSEYIINYWKSAGYGASLGLQYRIF